jgi:hypothetical protein
VCADRHRSRHGDVGSVGAVMSTPVKYTYHGEVLTLLELAARTGISHKTLKAWHLRGDISERNLDREVRDRALRQKALSNGISLRTASARMRGGMSEEEACSMPVVPRHLRNKARVAR